MTEITGKIHSIGETKTFGESFTKREFVLYVENKTNPEWSDYLKLELIKDKCSLIDIMNIGDEIKCGINLKGRLWTNPKGEEVCFNTIEAWKIDRLTGTMQQSAPQNIQNTSSQEPEEHNDLPF